MPVVERVHRTGHAEFRGDVRLPDFQILVRGADDGGAPQPGGAFRGRSFFHSDAATGDIDAWRSGAIFFRNRRA